MSALSVRYADTVSGSAAGLTPDLRFDWERAIAQINGTFSQFSSGEWSTQGAVTGSLFSASRGSLLGELAGTAGGSAHQDGTRSGQTIANIRIHSVRPRWGGFAGAGAGRTWDGAEWRRLLLGELGAWLRGDAGIALLSFAPSAVDDSVRYLDAQLTLSRTIDAVDLSVIAGGRAGDQSPGVGTKSRAWASLAATVWVKPYMAVVGGGGTYPVDPTQGFPGGRFLTVGFRLATPQARPMVRARSDGAGLAIESGTAQAVEAFSASRTGADSVSLRVLAMGAQTVEVMGDFSGWTPQALRRIEGGWWALTLPLTRRQYQLNVRVDGGSWLVPPGLLALQDEFGGSVGLLTID